jgi:2,4-dienoyl-CoA reductase (NADPH2)
MEPGGYGIETAIHLCQALEAEGLLDMVSVTGGWHEAPLPLITYHVPEGGYAYMADTIRRNIKAPVLVSTRINEGSVAEKMLEDSVADFVGMARPFLTDPDLPNKIKAGVPFNKCLGCSRGCNERIYKPLDATCVLNPEAGKEYLDIKYDRVEQNKGKKMLVVGGGPAGLYAAVKASKRGYTVTLATKENRLGGELYLAAIPPRKHDLFYFIKNKEYELQQAGVEVLLNTEVDAAFIEKFQPDYVAVAVGGRPFMPPVPGLNRENVYLPAQVLEPTPELLGKLKRGKTVVIGGGSVGLETAIFLSEKSMGSEEAVEFYFNQVEPLGLAPVLEFQDITIVEMTKKIGADLGSLRRFSVPDAKRLHIKMLTETKVLEVKDDVVVVEDLEGKKELPYDNIILAAGIRSLEPDFIKTLDEKGIPYGKIGDALKPGSAMNATQTAFEWSLTI